MKDETILPKPDKIKTPDEELQIFAELAETTYFAIIKRAVRRFNELYRIQSFMLSEEDKDQLALRHTKLSSEAEGMNKLVRLIEGARGELNKREKDNG